MTVTAGKRYRIPRGTAVYDHVLKSESVRQVTYPVHVERVGDGRVYWFGDCGRLMSCAADAVDLTNAVGDCCPQCGQRLPRRREGRAPTKSLTGSH